MPAATRLPISQAALRAALTIPLALLAGGAVAQAGPPPLQPPVLIDQVVATVGDAVILQSTLDAAVPSAIQREELRLERRLGLPERIAVERNELRKLVNQHCLAQAAKTLGVLPPAQVEQIVQSRLREAEQEQVRELGSQNRFVEELKRQDRSWQSFEREERLVEQANIARQLAVYSRLQGRRNLLVTPKKMRQFYRDNPQLFVFGAQADLAEVAFPVRGSHAATMEKVKQAAEVWRNEALQSRELQQRFPDSAQAPGDDFGITEDMDGPLRSDFKAFALGQPEGTVSEPIDDGDIIWLLKVLERREGSDLAFEDSTVQARIRVALEEQVHTELLKQTIRRSRDRTWIWPPQLRIL